MTSTRLGARPRSAIATWTSRAAVGVVLLVQFGVIASLDYFPTQDGPIHLEIAQLLNRFWDHEAGTYTRYLEVNPHLEPNWSVHLLLAGLLRLASWQDAERAIVLLCLTAWAAGSWFALRRVGDHTDLLLPLFLPVAANYLFHMGFWNFCLGVPLAFAFAAAWPTRGERDRTGWVLLSLASLGLYFCHLVAFAAAWVMVACGIVATVVGATGSPSGWRESLTTLRRQVVPAILVALPGVLMALVFFGRQEKEVVERPIRLLWSSFTSLDSLASFSRSEQDLSRAFGVVLLCGLAAALTVRLGSGRFRSSDGFALATLTFTGLYFILPSGIAGGGYLSQRLLLFAIVSALLWLAAQPLPLAIRAALGLAGLVIWVPFVASHAASYRRLDQALQEFVAVAPTLDREATLLTLAADETKLRLDGRTLSYRVDAFENAGGYLALARGGVDLVNYQAGRRYFPVRFRAGLDTSVSLIRGGGRHRGNLENVDIEGFERGGGRVDYVYLFGFPHVPKPLTGVLGRDFESIPIAQGQVAKQLFRHRQAPGGVSTAGLR
jgi:hypothetical protein